METVAQSKATKLNVKTNIISDNISKHEIYKHLSDMEALKTFASYHVFCVYDFMFLAKSLQHALAPSGPEWRGNLVSSAATRAINEIILEEESDVDPKGGFISHHDLYLRAMTEIGANSSLINSFKKTRDLSQLPAPVSNFLAYHLDLAKNGNPMEIAGAFFLGRESLLPHVFEAIVDILPEEKAPTLYYYLVRHIELDGRNHSELGEAIISEIAEKQGEDISLAFAAGEKTLNLRLALWDFILEEIKKCQIK